MSDTADLIPPGPLTADEFLAWQEERASEGRFELSSGAVVEMQAERTQHAGAKFSISLQLGNQLGLEGPCRPFLDQMAIKLPNDDVYEPDAFVRCGASLGPDVLYVTDPVLIFEVTSPSTSRIDLSVKRVAYFQAPSVQHVVTVALKERMVIHDQRGDAPDRLSTTILSGGTRRFDPPGVEIDFDAVFAAAESV